jgi:hypothetical protein
VQSHMEIERILGKDGGNVGVRGGQEGRQAAIHRLYRSLRFRSQCGLLKAYALLGSALETGIWLSHPWVPPQMPDNKLELVVEADVNKETPRPRESSTGLSSMGQDARDAAAHFNGRTAIRS